MLRTARTVPRARRRFQHAGARRSARSEQAACRLRPFVWLSGGRIRWRTIQTVLDAGYVDAFRRVHPEEPGFTVPARDPHVRLDYAFVPAAYADRIAGCRRVEHPDAATASDHLPLVLDLNL